MENRQFVIRKRLGDIYRTAMPELSHATIADKLKQFIATESGLGDTVNIDQETKLLKEGILDSLMIMSVIGFCEREFGCSFAPDEVGEEDFGTIKALSTRVRALSCCRAKAETETPEGL
jgi:acyl carrier protein